MRRPARGTVSATCASSRSFAILVLVLSGGACSLLVDSADLTADAADPADARDGSVADGATEAAADGAAELDGARNEAATSGGDAESDATPDGTTIADASGDAPVADAPADARTEAGFDAGIPPGRVTTGLLALYTFEEGAGAATNDVSGVAPLLPLEVPASGATWVPGGLSVSAGTVVKSSTGADKIVSAIATSGEFTFEAWVTPGATNTAEIAGRIVGLSNTNSTNAALAQVGNKYGGALDTSIKNDLYNSVGMVSLALTHLVMVRSTSVGDKVIFYVGGGKSAEFNTGGNLASWTSRPLVLGTSGLTSLPWVGTYHLVAVYGRALTAGEVSANFAAGP